MLKYLRRQKKLPIDREYFLSLLGGSEGGLATTTAIIVGLMVSSASREVVVTSALVAFLVQAFNGSIGHFSSERTNDEIDDIEKKEGYRKPAKDALYYFLSHTATSLIVLMPVVIITDSLNAIIVTLSISLFILFTIGWYKGSVVKNSRFVDGMEMVMFGLLVIVVGALSGLALR